MSRGKNPGSGRPIGLWLPQRPKVNLAQETSWTLREDGFHSVGNIFGAQSFRRVLGAAAGEFCGHASRTDHTDADTVFPEIFRQAARKTDDTPFGGAIDAAASECVFAGQRTDVDDVARSAADHGRRHSTREEKDALKIGIQHAIPIGLGFFVGRAEQTDATAPPGDKRHTAPQRLPYAGSSICSAYYRHENSPS